MCVCVSLSLSLSLCVCVCVCGVCVSLSPLSLSVCVCGLCVVCGLSLSLSLSLSLCVRVCVCVCGVCVSLSLSLSVCVCARVRACVQGSLSTKPPPLSRRIQRTESMAAGVNVIGEMINRHVLFKLCGSFLCLANAYIEEKHIKMISGDYVPLKTRAMMLNSALH